jgi:uncharacterized glyoxalase superfamily protein PhnB
MNESKAALIPNLRYRAAAAIENGAIAHAQLTLGNAMIMLSGPSVTRASIPRVGQTRVRR